MNLLDNAVAAMFLSFIFGMMVNSVLSRTTFYDRLGERYLFSDAKTYEKRGVLWFRKILLNTPLGWFNREIRISEDRSPAKLRTIRTHMVNSELAHWAGFAAMLALMFVAWSYRGPKIAAAYLICNVLGNLYPCLLQQYNKRRIMKAIEIAGSRQARNASSDDRETRTATSHAGPDPENRK